jgi:hypothetical protein
MSWFDRKKADNNLTVGDRMKNNLDTIKDNRHEYNFNLIISLIGGSHDMCSEVINLSPVKSYFGYYGIDDTIIYYDNYIRNALLKEGIASYKGSGDILIITTSEDRVNNLIEELKFKK